MFETLDRLVTADKKTRFLRDSMRSRRFRANGANGARPYARSKAETRINSLTRAKRESRNNPGKLQVCQPMKLLIDFQNQESRTFVF